MSAFACGSCLTVVACLLLGALLSLLTQYAVPALPPESARFGLGSGAGSSFVPADWELNSSDLHGLPQHNDTYYTVQNQRVVLDLYTGSTFHTKDPSDPHTTTTTGQSWLGGSGGLAASSSTPQRNRDGWRSKSIHNTKAKGLPLRRNDGGKSYQHFYNRRLEHFQSQERKSQRYKRRLRGRTTTRVAIPVSKLYDVFSTVMEQVKPHSPMWLVCACLCCMFFLFTL